MWSHSLSRLSLEPYKHYFWSINVPCIFEQLLNKFAATFAYAHVSDSLICRNIDAAIFLRSRQSEHMVVFVYRSTYCTQRVVAVGHSVRNRKLFQSAGTCRLNDTYISDVVRHHGIEAYAHLLAFATINIVSAENLISNSLFSRFIGSRHTCIALDYMSPIEEIYSMIDKFYHNDFI